TSVFQSWFRPQDTTLGISPFLIRGRPSCLDKRQINDDAPRGAEWNGPSVTVSSRARRVPGQAAGSRSGQRLDKSERGAFGTLSQVAVPASETAGSGGSGCTTARTREGSGGEGRVRR